MSNFQVNINIPQASNNAEYNDYSIKVFFNGVEFIEVNSTETGNENEEPSDEEDGFMRFTAEEDMQITTVTENTWQAFDHNNATHIRLQGDVDFEFCHGDNANGGFLVPQDSPIIVEVQDLQVFAINGTGDLTLKYQRVKGRRV